MKTVLTATGPDTNFALFQFMSGFAEFVAWPMLIVIIFVVYYFGRKGLKRLDAAAVHYRSNQIEKDAVDPNLESPSSFDFEPEFEPEFDYESAAANKVAPQASVLTDSFLGLAYIGVAIMVIGIAFWTALPYPIAVFLNGGSSPFGYYAGTVLMGVSLLVFAAAAIVRVIEISRASSTSYSEAPVRETIS